MLTSAEIRRAYIDFFVQKHAHTEVPSSPVVPHDDPTLLFTNAGMNQFKPIFLGQEKRAYTRAVDTQKCIRAGGKHNDLDDVGRSRRHHTFFEMLGNWSFGDYFKRGAIEMSWELLTDVFKLDPTRIHVTCFEGDEKNGVPRDLEAAKIWKEVAGLPDDHIHFFGKDNFWEMGDTGPCGPCTEIFYDRTDDKTGGQHVNGEDPRVMEIWNNVFIQYNRNADRTLTDLPAQHVDTGMGFERICQVLQGVESNYSIDLWHPFWTALKSLSGHEYGGKFPKTNSVDAAAEAADESLRKDIAFRVIGDHVRCLTFALTDGATPSNEGRGYVLRRILRRAVRFGRQSLGLKEPFLHTLVQVVVDTMGDAFPELRKIPRRVAELIRDEEQSFGRTLDRGIVLFNDAVVAALLIAIAQKYSLGQPNIISKSNSEYHFQFARLWNGAGMHSIRLKDVVTTANEEALELIIPSDAAFQLHDTFGFPIDLTQIMAAERGMTVDLDGFNRLMKEAVEKARAGGKTGENAVYALPPAALAQLEANGVARTNDRPKYAGDPTPAKVVAIWNGDALVTETPPDTDVAVLLDTTPFYAEMGGQIGDSGMLDFSGTGFQPVSSTGKTRVESPCHDDAQPASATGGRVASAALKRPNEPTAATTPGLATDSDAPAQRFTVADTRAVAGYVLHVGRMNAGSLKVGDPVTATVTDHRDRIESNHTATHLLNWSLKKHLGDGVQQKGSLVDADKLRFDFSHGKPLSEAELDGVEAAVAAANALTVHTEEVPQEQALKINGLRAVFGEKYPPVVRVVSVGVPVADLLADPTNAKWPDYSIEFCGGTHVAATERIGRFAVVAEESVSKGVRRIVAVTGPKAAEAWAAVDKVAALIAVADKAADADVATLIPPIQQALVASTLPLAAKRRAQAKIVALQARAKAAEKAAKKSGTAGGVDAVAAAGLLLEAALDLGGGRVVVGEIAGASDDQLRAAIDSIRKKAPSHGVMLGSAGDGKVSFVSVVSDDLIAKGLKAGDWIRETAKIAGGGGGGRPQMAQAGGKDPAKLAAALARAVDVAKAALN